MTAALRFARFIDELNAKGIYGKSLAQRVSTSGPVAFLTSPDGTAMRAHGLETPPYEDRHTAALSWAQMALEVV